MKLSRAKRHLVRKGLPVITGMAILFCCSFSIAAEPAVKHADALTAVPLSSAPFNIQQTLTKDGDFNAVTILPDDNLYSITAENAEGKGKIELYSTPVKFTDEDGTVSFIDTGMTQNSARRSLFDGYSYKNTANSFTAEFSTNAEKGFSLNKQFTFGAYQADTNAAKGYINTDELGNGRMVYEDIYGSGTSLAHTNINTGVKNEIVLTEPAEQNVFSFLYTSSTHDLVPAEDDAAVFLVDKADEENIDYIFQPIYVCDSYKAESQEAPGAFKHFTEGSTYRLTPVSDTQTRVDIVVPEEFLNSPEVVYPVQITAASSEGYLETDNSAAIVDDTFVKESSPNSNYYLYDYMSFGYNGGRMHGYVRFPDMVTLPAGTSIDRAEFILRFRSGQTTADPSGGACSRVTTFREGKDITWNTRPDSGAGLITTDHIWEDGEIRYYKFPVTHIVSQWLDGTANINGFKFGYCNEYYNDYNSVVSSDGEAYRAPKLLVYYKTVGPASGITNGEMYYLRNANSGKYLDVDIHTNNVIQWPYHGCANQQWKVKYQSDGTYKIYTMDPSHNGKCLDIENLTNNNVDVFTDGSGIYLRWIIVPNGDGSYRLYNQWGNNTDKVMTATSDSNVCQAVWTGSNNQKWYFEKSTIKFVSMNTFSSFSIGNDNMSGYNYFNNYLEGRTLNNKQYYPLIRFNYTNGKISKNDLIKYLAYSDVAFIDSHGYPPYIEMRDNSNTIYDKLYLSSDIGTSFKSGSTTKTNTPFNKKTKWLIIQACSQLDYTAGASSSENSALQWAKALLGDGVRMHGVLSYYASGPAGDLAGSRMNTFMGTQTNSSNRPNMITGWKLANEELIGSSAWAGICHRENLDDKLYWGWTSNTASGSAYTIDRYSYKQGTQKPLPLSTPRKISTNSGSTIRLLSESENIADQNFTLTNKAFTASQLKKLQNTFESEKISISPEGKLAYLNNSASPTETISALTWTEAQAISKAKEYLDSIGLLPQDDYLIKTSTVVREELDVFNETAGPAETVSWTIRFYQTYNGVPVVSKDDNGILLTVTENGLHSLQYNWKNIAPAIQTKTMSNAYVKTLSENEAIENYCNKVDLKNLDINTNISYRQVYLFQDNEVIPAWVFGTEDAFFEPIYIHAITGERVPVV